MMIQSDDDTFLIVKEASRPRYKRIWSDFKDFIGNGKALNLRLPSEDEVLRFVKHLSEEKGIFNNFIIS